MATVSGDIELMPMGELVVWIANRGPTGTLTVRRRNSESTFVIRKGLVWQATSKDPREFLGQHLINFGYISEDQLQNAFDTQQETHVPLGRILVLVDAVRQDQLDRVLLFKTRESLLEALSWTEGSFRFSTEDMSDPDLDMGQPVDLLEVHSESIARASMWREIHSIFPNDATRVEAVGDLARLSGFDRRLVELMSAGHSIGEASLELHAMDFQTYARLYDLYNRGVVRPRTGPPVRSSMPRAHPAPTSTLTSTLASPLAPPLRSTGEYAGPAGFSPLAPPSGSLPVVRGTLRSEPPPVAVASPPPEATTAHNAVANRMPGFAPGSLAPPLPTPTGERTPLPAPGGLAPLGTPPRAGSSSPPAPVAERTLELLGGPVGSEVSEPHASLRVALAGRDWTEAFLIAQRILERDPIDAEAIAAWRVANTQLVKHRAADELADLRVIPRLAMAREQVALAHLTSKERYVLSRIDGRRSLQQIAAVSPIQKSELVRIVNSFVSRGVLEIKP